MKLNSKIIVAILALGIFFTSCKKKKQFKNEDGQITEDNRSIQGQVDDAMSDADNAINDFASLTGKAIAPPPGIQSTPWGSTVDTNQLSSGILTVNFDGVTVYNNRKRSGSIKLTLQNYTQGTRWKDSMAVLQVDYLNYKVTRASDGKSLKFNGTQYVTNVVGGNLWLLLLGFQTTVVRTITGTNLQVTFDDNQTATWNINRRYTYAKESGLVYSCKGEGIGTYNGISQLENWGTSREGDQFTSQVTSPVIWNTTCGAWAPVQGQVLVKVDSREFELKVTLAVDANGNVVAVQPNNCAYGWQVQWTYKGKTKNKIFKYW